MTRGIQPWSVKPSYGTYRSPYGPNYKVPFNLAGIDRRLLMKYAIYMRQGGSFEDDADCVNSSMTAGGLAGVAGFFALFFFSDVPRVRKDIMQKIPIIGEHFVREIPPSDNPF